MNGSDQVLPLMESAVALLRDYPGRGDMASIRVVAGESVVVQLAAGELGAVAAGIVEWDRTLAAGRCTLARTSDGAAVVPSLAGHIDEDGTDVEVCGTAPYDSHVIGAELLPGE